MSLQCYQKYVAAVAEVTRATEWEHQRQHVLTTAVLLHALLERPPQSGTPLPAGVSQPNKAQALLELKLQAALLAAERLKQKGAAQRAALEGKIDALRRRAERAELQLRSPGYVRPARPILELAGACASASDSGQARAAMSPLTRMLQSRLRGPHGRPQGPQPDFSQGPQPEFSQGTQPEFLQGTQPDFSQGTQPERRAGGSRAPRGGAEAAVRTKSLRVTGSKRPLPALRSVLAHSLFDSTSDPFTDTFSDSFLQVITPLSHLLESPKHNHLKRIALQHAAPKRRLKPLSKNDRSGLFNDGAALDPDTSPTRGPKASARDISPAKREGHAKFVI